MKFANRALSITIAWYLLIICFFFSYFLGSELPEVSSELYYLIVIPYLGFGALIWSVFTGVGVAVLLLGMYCSFLHFQKGGKFTLVCHLLVGLLGGFAFKLVSGT